MMNSSFGFHFMSRLAPRLRANSIPLLIAALLLTACGGLGDSLAPGKAGGAPPAQVAFTTSVAASVGRATDDIALVVSTRYVRRDGTTADIATQSFTLGTGASQALPIPVELAPCLADPSRESAGPQDKSCLVIFQLELTLNGVVVDRQTIGPLRLAPGVAARVSKPVALFEIVAVDVAIAGGDEITVAHPITAIPGETIALTATILDRQRQVVTGRAVTWKSDAPAVARIDSVSGAVTAWSVGLARITASFGAVSTTISLRVERPPVWLSVMPGATSGRGMVRSTPAGIECRIDGTVASGSCSFAFPVGSVVTLESEADAGSAIAPWAGACESASGSASCRLTLSEARATRASFSALGRVSISAGASDGHGRVTGPAGLDCRIDRGAATGSCAADVAEGTTITLVASKDGPDAATAARQVFGGWGAACAEAQGDSCTFVVARQPQVATVRFHGEQRLDVAVQGSGAGRVVATGGIACTRSAGKTTGACSDQVLFGSVVTLSAVAEPQSSFSGWRGACQGQAGSSCDVRMTEARSAVASFTTLRRIHVRGGTGDGAGRVTGPEGLDCRIDGTVTTGACEVSVEEGAHVTLRATAEAGLGSRQSFSGWEGECRSSGGFTCELQVSGAAVTVSANFQDEQPLHVDFADDGGGRVFEDAGISCARANGVTTGVCDRRGPWGVSVTLNAAPDSKSLFGGWIGCDTPSGTTCTTMMSRARTVSARFTMQKVTLTLEASGAGAGTIVLHGQSACALALGQLHVTCTQSFDVGTTVTVSGKAGANSTFSGFRNACTGTTPCQLVLTSSKVVRAEFARRQYELEVHLTGSGGGSATLNGTAFCSLAIGQSSTTCSRLVNAGSVALLSASPGTGATMTGFDSGCAGTNPCSLTISGDVGIGAAFTQLPVSLSLSLTGSGGGKVVSGGAISCTLFEGTVAGSCTEVVPYGTTVTLSATAQHSTNFVAWAGACAGQATVTCSLTLTGNASVVAQYLRKP
ncbi:MAG: hypothetical protein ABIZ91_03220 [Gemmatimonadaceae bacterium]